MGVQEPPALFALRDEETEELVDDDNLARKIDQGSSLKLTASPLIEAAEMIDKLSSRDDRILKLATYNLQRLIREPLFTSEFLRRGGLTELVGVVQALPGGNTLAYALVSVQNLLETKTEGWEDLGDEFIAKVVQTCVTQERINVCRPATAILKKLVDSGPSQSTGSESTEDHDIVTAYGFEVVYARIQAEPNFLPTLVHRLSSADSTLCLYSLSFLNSLMTHVTESLFDNFTTELEKLQASSAVARLMESTRSEEMVTAILEYQDNMIRVYRHRYQTLVTAADKRHVASLTFIWRQARIEEEVMQNDSNGYGAGSHSSTQPQKKKWRRLGFTNENVAKDFNKTGWLGLSTCEAYVRHDPEAHAKTTLETIRRPQAKQCPWGRASIEVVEILAEHWGISSGRISSNKFLPFLLFFSRVHYLALRFWLRIWTESGAALSDFDRVSALVRSQVRHALSDESEGKTTWFDLESIFLESEYRSVRDRQMKELEVEDDLANKSAVSSLRSRLYKESYEFVRQQRIQCLLEGAWLRTPATTTGPPGTLQASFAAASVGRGRKATLDNSTNAANGASPAKPWRFYRLSPNHRALHFCDAVEPVPLRDGLEDLSEKIDLSPAVDVAALTAKTHTSLPIGGQRAQDGNSQYSFSLLRSNGVSLADLTAVSSTQYSEWIDGLGMLLKGSGVDPEAMKEGADSSANGINTQETADFIRALTEVGLNIKLLDLTGEKVEIPDTVPPPSLPTSLDFFFADL